MADNREQYATGPFPSDPVPGSRVGVSQGGVDTHSVKSGVGQGTRPGAKPTGTSSTSSFVTLLSSAALALVFGGAGAWAYERYLVQPRAERTPDATTPKEEDPATKKTLGHLDERMNSLSDQYKQLQSRLEALPKPAPRRRLLIWRHSKPRSPASTN